MVSLVIFFLSLVIFGIASLLGYHVAAPMVLADFNTGLLLSIGIAIGVTVMTYSMFNLRTDGREALVLWYSFDSPAMLALGAVTAFVSSAFFGCGAFVLAFIFGGIASILVVRAVARGPVYGWEEFVTRRLRQ